MRAFLLLFALCLPGLASAENELALVQYDADIHLGDYSTNKERLSRFALEAVRHGAKIVVFPEGSHYGYATSRERWCAPWSDARGCRDVSKVAEQIPGGKTSIYWEAFAKRHKVFVLFNLPEADGSLFFNTTAVFGPEGYVGRYRKRELYTADKFYATPGNDGPFTFETPYGRFGLLICMDANFPQLFEEYKSLGVSQLIIPMDWDQDPLGRNGARPARVYFQERATDMGVDIFASDVSRWDGTGAYLHNGRERVRKGLDRIAIGRDGISYFSFPAAR